MIVEALRPPATATQQLLSTLIPSNQQVETRELVATPFKARHRGKPVVVKAVFKRTAVVFAEDGVPYQARAAEIEVEAGTVRILDEAEAARSWWRRRPKNEEDSERLQRLREASDRRARASATAVSAVRERQPEKPRPLALAAVMPARSDRPAAASRVADLVRLSASIAASARAQGSDLERWGEAAEDWAVFGRRERAELASQASMSNELASATCELRHGLYQLEYVDLASDRLRRPEQAGAPVLELHALGHELERTAVELRAGLQHLTEAPLQRRACRREARQSMGDLGSLALEVGAAAEELEAELQRMSRELKGQRESSPLSLAERRGFRPRLVAVGAP